MITAKNGVTFKMAKHLSNSEWCFFVSHLNYLLLILKCEVQTALYFTFDQNIIVSMKIDGDFDSAIELSWMMLVQQQTR